MSRFLSCLGRFLSERKASAGIEFGIVAPLLGLILGGAVDLGGVVFVKFRLDNAVSAGANYAIVNGAKVNSSDSESLASSIATILQNSGAGAVNGTITVNNGTVATITNGSVALSGTAANANSCYCPTRSGNIVAFGSQKGCGDDCGDGTGAGRFVVIDTNRSYSPLFSNYGIVSNGQVASRAVVRVQ